MGRLENRIALITGGASGIGLACMQRFAQEGAQVAAFDVASPDPAGAKSIEEHDPDVAFLQVDVQDEQEIREGVQRITHDRGPIDILVNAAGVHGIGSIDILESEEWDRVLGINLKGTFLCSRAAVRHMIPKKSGVIVSMASISGKEGNANMAAYSVSQAGVICFTKSLGKEMLEYGIRVNCVAPALIDSPLLEGMEPERVEFLTSRIPMGRLGQPSEVAATILFIVSDESSFTTGACFDVSGGRATY